MTTYWERIPPKKQNGHHVQLAKPVFWPRYRCPLCGWLDLQLTADRTSLMCLACQTVMPAPKAAA